MARNRTNDPRFPIYWEIRGFSQDEAKIKAKSECRKRSVRCIEYWLGKGLSLDDAKKEVRRIQDNGEKQKGKIISQEQREKQSKAMKKLNYLEYWIEKYGEDIGPEKFEEYKSRQKDNASKGSKSRLEKDPDTYINSSIRRPEYWIKQGYSEDEAKIIVAKKQSRSIDFFINKYGEVDGIKRWKDRHNKWYKSFYESNNDLILINEKRKLNSHVGYYTKDVISQNDTLNFYLISLLDENNIPIIKYGLTKQDCISKRWKVSLDYNLLLFNQMNSHKAIDLENNFNAIFGKSYTPSRIKTTECFIYTDENFDKALTLLKEYDIITLDGETLND